MATPNVAKSEKTSTQQYPDKCNFCAQGDTVAYCDTCSDTLCKTCQATHAKHARDHQITLLCEGTESREDDPDLLGTIPGCGEPPEDSSVFGGMSIHVLCDVHTEQVVDRYCASCKVLACITCCQNAHGGHEIKDLSTEDNTLHEIVVEMLNDVRQKKDYLSERNCKMVEAPSKITASSKSVIEQLTLREAEIHKIVTKEFQKSKQKAERLLKSSLDNCDKAQCKTKFLERDYFDLFLKAQAGNDADKNASIHLLMGYQRKLKRDTSSFQEINSLIRAVNTFHVSKPLQESLQQLEKEIPKLFNFRQDICFNEASFKHELSLGGTDETKWAAARPRKVRGEYRTGKPGFKVNNNSPDVKPNPTTPVPPSVKNTQPKTDVLDFNKRDLSEFIPTFPTRGGATRNASDSVPIFDNQSKRSASVSPTPKTKTKSKFPALSDTVCAVMDFPITNKPKYVPSNKRTNTQQRRTFHTYATPAVTTRTQTHNVPLLLISNARCEVRGLVRLAQATGVHYMFTTDCNRKLAKLYDLRAPDGNPFSTVKTLNEYPLLTITLPRHMFAILTKTEIVILVVEDNGIKEKQSVKFNGNSEAMSMTSYDNTCFLLTEVAEDRNSIRISKISTGTFKFTETIRGAVNNIYHRNHVIKATPSGDFLCFYVKDRRILRYDRHGIWTDTITNDCMPWIEFFKCNLRTLHVDKHGRLWIGDSCGKIYVFQVNDPHYKEVHNIGGAMVYSITTYDDSAFISYYVAEDKTCIEKFEIVC